MLKAFLPCIVKVIKAGPTIHCPYTESDAVLPYLVRHMFDAIFYNIKTSSLKTENCS